MVRVVVVVAVLITTTAFGTSASVGLYSLWYGPQDGLPWVCPLVAGVHLFWCGLYALLGESFIEDGVKSGIVVVLGGLLLRFFPLIGLSAISIAVSAMVANQSVQWLLAKIGSRVSRQ